VAFETFEVSEVSNYSVYLSTFSNSSVEHRHLLVGATPRNLYSTAWGGTHPKRRLCFPSRESYENVNATHHLRLRMPQNQQGTAHASYTSVFARIFHPALEPGACLAPGGSSQGRGRAPFLFKSTIISRMIDTGFTSSLGLPANPNLWILNTDPF